MFFILLIIQLSTANVMFNWTSYKIMNRFIQQLSSGQLSFDANPWCETIENSTAPINCDAAGNVVAINFYKKPYKNGFISSDVATLKFLKHLDVRDAGLVGSIPEEITQCSLLTTILTAGNNLRGRIPLGMLNLPLTTCTLMRTVSENNCFECPVPKLTCTGNLRCSTGSGNCSTEISTLTMPDVTYATQTSMEIQQASISTTTTSSATKSIQQRTFTMKYSAAETFSQQSLNNTGENQQSVDNKNFVIIILACALGITIPMVCILVCFYGRRNGTEHSSCCVPNSVIEDGLSSDQEVRMHAAPNSIYGPINVPPENVYNVVMDNSKKHTYDIVPSVGRQSQYEGVHSKLEE